MDRPKPPNAGKGRPKGATNRATREIKAFATAMLEDPDYVRDLKVRLKRGKAPHVESLLYHYAYGKPTERHEVTGAEGGPLLVGWMKPEDGA